MNSAVNKKQFIARALTIVAALLLVFFCYKFFNNMYTSLKYHNEVTNLTNKNIKEMNISSRFILVHSERINLGRGFKDVFILSDKTDTNIKFLLVENTMNESMTITAIPTHHLK